MLRKENPLPLYDGDPYLNATERQNQTDSSLFTARSIRGGPDSVASSQVTVTAFRPKYLLERAMPLNTAQQAMHAEHYSESYAPSCAATSEMSIHLMSEAASQLSIAESYSSVNPSIKSLLQNNFQTCVLCEQRYVRPKLLACLHSFCQDCIDHDTAGEHEDRIFVCPICDCHLSMPPAGAIDLPDDHFIVTLLRESSRESRHQLEQPKRCILCVAQNPAHATCLDCDGYICIDCMRVTLYTYRHVGTIKLSAALYTFYIYMYMYMY